MVRASGKPAPTGEAVVHLRDKPIRQLRPVRQSRPGGAVSAPWAHRASIPRPDRRSLPHWACQCRDGYSTPITRVSVRGAIEHDGPPAGDAPNRRGNPVARSGACCSRCSRGGRTRSPPSTVNPRRTRRRCEDSCYHHDRRRPAVARGKCGCEGRFARHARPGAVRVHGGNDHAPRPVPTRWRDSTRRPRSSSYVARRRASS